MPILSGLRNEDVQWAIDDFVVSDPMIPSCHLPFLVLARLRETQPYTPGQVLRQLGCKQVISQTGKMRKFATDHEMDQEAFVKMIL